MPIRTKAQYERAKELLPRVRDPALREKASQQIADYESGVRTDYAAPSGVEAISAVRQKYKGPEEELAKPGKIGHEAPKTAIDYAQNVVDPLAEKVVNPMMLGFFPGMLSGMTGGIGTAGVSELEHATTGEDKIRAGMAEHPIATGAGQLVGALSPISPFMLGTRGAKLLAPGLGKVAEGALGGASGMLTQGAAEDFAEGTQPTVLGNLIRAGTGATLGGLGGLGAKALGRVAQRTELKAPGLADYRAAGGETRVGVRPLGVAPGVEAGKLTGAPKAVEENIRAAATAGGGVTPEEIAATKLREPLARQAGLSEDAEQKFAAQIAEKEYAESPEGKATVVLDEFTKAAQDALESRAGIPGARNKALLRKYADAPDTMTKGELQELVEGLDYAAKPGKPAGQADSALRRLSAAARDVRDQFQANAVTDQMLQGRTMKIRTQVPGLYRELGGLSAMKHAESEALKKQAEQRGLMGLPVGQTYWGYEELPAANKTAFTAALRDLAKNPSADTLAEARRLAEAAGVTPGLNELLGTAAYQKLMRGTEATHGVAGQSGLRAYVNPFTMKMRLRMDPLVRAGAAHPEAAARAAGFPGLAGILGNVLAPPAHAAGGGGGGGGGGGEGPTHEIVEPPPIDLDEETAARWQRATEHGVTDIDKVLADVRDTAAPVDLAAERKKFEATGQLSDDAMVALAEKHAAAEGITFDDALARLKAYFRQGTQEAAKKTPRRASRAKPAVVKTASPEE